MSCSHPKQSLVTNVLVRRRRQRNFPYQDWHKTSLFLFQVGLFDQQDRYVVADGVNPVAGTALELIFILVIGEWSFADRTGEDLNQVAVNHNATIVAPFQSTFWSGNPKVGELFSKHSL